MKAAWFGPEERKTLVLRNAHLRAKAEQGAALAFGALGPYRLSQWAPPDEEGKLRLVLACAVCRRVKAMVIVECPLVPDEPLARAMARAEHNLARTLGEAGCTHLGALEGSHVPALA